MGMAVCSYLGKVEVILDTESRALHRHVSVIAALLLLRNPKGFPGTASTVWLQFG